MKIIFDSEAELEDYIYDRFMEEGVVCIDDTYHQYLERQLNLGSYGIADLVGITVGYEGPGIKVLNATIYELKKEKITSDAFAQVARYAAGIRKIVEGIDPDCNVWVTCCLVATGIDESCFILNESEICFYQVYFDPASGVSFKDCSEGWARGASSSQTIASLIAKAKMPPEVSGVAIE